jgi:hypothetical protein
MKLLGCETSDDGPNGKLKVKIDVPYGTSRNHVRRGKTLSFFA